MSDPFSITVGVLGVLQAAFSTCKFLRGLIEGFSNAPETLKSVSQEIQAVGGQLSSLSTELSEQQNSNYSPNQLACLDNLKAVSQQCHESCNDFSKKLADLTSHSTPPLISSRDKGRLLYHEKDITLFKAKLQRYKQTLDLAIGVATFQTVRDNKEALQSLETKIASCINSFTGQMEGLQLAISSLSLNSLSIREEDVDMVLKVLNGHRVMLAQCLKFCEHGLKETTAATGTTVKYAEAFDKARHWIGNIGFDGTWAPNTPLISVDRMIARDEAIQGVGNMSREVARDFFK
ncbi:hypothetical protein VFPPC_14781 [Pochonia chlamydosporia 170]|uniref:Azaphilone pigments biosynthesis cluster protein L N-terminal domain-containing protein n=1 Tax=Pochonia chlamydosporia 170 TaxID=1380566 RepID=A0A179F206_METCM|nr:hypothetical protein VFPPC_14781 [Pochonia chlamydosporia 170]OAQ59484.1 hypothetical protein VFPPC_14781 [Pochonia chlamydosporia 170]